MWVEAKRPKIQDLPWLHIKFKASLGYMSLCQKTGKRKMAFKLYCWERSGIVYHEVKEEIRKRKSDT